MSLTTTLVFCSATSQEHKCINSICNSLLIPLFLFFVSIPLSLSVSMKMFHSSAVQLMLLFYSSFTALPIPHHLKSLFLSVTSFSFHLPVLHFPIDLLAMGTPLHSICLFFVCVCGIFILPSLLLRLLSLFSSLFLSLSVLLGKAAFRLGFSRPRCEFWRRNDQHSWLCWSLPLGQILHPIPPEWNLVLPVSPPSSFSSSRTTPAKRRAPRQLKNQQQHRGQAWRGSRSITTLTKSENIFRNSEEKVTSFVIRIIRMFFFVH